MELGEGGRRRTKEYRMGEGKLTRSGEKRVGEGEVMKREVGKEK